MKKIILFFVVIIWGVFFAYSQTITVVPFAQDSLCIGKSYQVFFYTTGKFNSDNMFIAEMSNDNFKTFERVGWPSYWGYIDIRIPESFIVFGKYKLRIVSTSPYVVSEDNKQELVILPSSLPKNITINSWGRISVVGSAMKFWIDQTISKYFRRAVWKFETDADIETYEGFDPPYVTFWSEGEKVVSCQLLDPVNALCIDTTSTSYRNLTNIELRCKVYGCNIQISSTAYVDTQAVALDYYKDIKGRYDQIWILPTGSMIIFSPSDLIFVVEPGGQLKIKGLASQCVFYMKPGSKLDFDVPPIYSAFLLSPGVSTPSKYRLDSLGAVANCNEMNFYYRWAPAEGVAALLALGFTKVDEGLAPSIGTNIEPNHAGDLIKVTLPELERIPRIAIKNLLGKDVLSFDIQNSNSSEILIDISNLPNGIYFVQVGYKLFKFVKI